MTYSILLRWNWQHPPTGQQPTGWRRFVATREKRIMAWAYGVMGTNAAIFGLWQVSIGRPSMHRFMNEWFMSGKHHLHNFTRRWPSFILDQFSHRTLPHIGFNMLTFYSFARGMSTLHNRLPRPFALHTSELVAMYTVGGAFGSLFSSALPGRVSVPGLGASNAICAMVAYQCLAQPTSGYSIMFIPMNGHDLLAWFVLVNLVLGYRAQRRIGSVLIDGFGHLGGAAVGAAVFGFKWQQARSTGIVASYPYRGEHWEKVKSVLQL